MKTRVGGRDAANEDISRGSLAEGEVRLVAGGHAATLGGRFRGATGGRGGRGLLVARGHAATPPRRDLIFRAVVLIPLLFHSGPLFTQAH